MLSVRISSYGDNNLVPKTRVCYVYNVDFVDNRK